MDDKFKKSPWYKFLPPANLDVHKENLEEFFFTMHERHMIWYRRFMLKQQQPWTTNPIFKQYKFCNVYRELDRSSQYLINNSFLTRTDSKQVLFDILVHRVFNKPETFEAIGGYPYLSDFEIEWFTNLIGFHEKLKDFKTLNQDAYKINTYIWGGTPRWEAYSRFIVGTYFEALDEIYHCVKNISQPEAIIKRLRIQGVGLFLAHEYYQDICLARKYFHKKFARVDANMWTNSGPGCDVGLRLIFPSIKDGEQFERLTWLRELSRDYLAHYAVQDGGFKYLHWDIEKQQYFVDPAEPNLNVGNMEFWCCEYQKYKKIQWQVGKQRSKFIVKTKT